MWYHRFIIPLLVTGICVPCGFTMEVDPNKSDNATVVNPMSANENGEIQFAHDFYKEILKEEKGNWIISPFSAHAVLGLAAFGAAGITAEQLNKGLHLPEDNGLAKLSFTRSRETLNSFENITLDIANGIYVSNRLKLKQSYQELAADVFYGTAEELNFEDVEIAAKTINEWVFNKTQGKIKDIVSKDELEPSTDLVLLNAVYFKADWATKFDKEFTENGTFYIDNNTTKSVPMMFITSNFFCGVLEELDAMFVILPYKNKNLEMVLVVPYEVDGLPKIDENTHKLTKQYLIDHGIETEVSLRLPKLKIESKIDLETTLKNLGMEDMFTSHANFSNLSDSPLSVKKVLQKSFIEVNEDGSEAAVVTETEIQARTDLSFRIYANKPFIFYIQSPEYILFEGRITDPSM